MSFSVTMPQLGESVTEGTVTRWLKAVGDTVAADEPLLEVSTDKVDTEIPSPASGVLLAITAGEDAVVEVGGELAVIGEAAEAGGGGAPAATAPAVEVPAASDAGGAATAPDAAASAAPAGSPSPAQPASVPTASVPAEALEDEVPEPPAPAAAPAGGPSGGGETTPVLLPALGESVTEGTVTRWLKAVGDTVAADEPLLEVSTDKVDTEIPSPASGVLLEIAVGEDETVEVGTRLAVIGAPGAAAQAPAPAQPEGPAAAASPGPAAEAPASSAAPAQAPSAPVADQPPAGAPAGQDDADGSGSAYVTPIVRKLAAERGVDLALVAGTGVGGRIRKQDVVAAAEAADAARAAEEEAARAAARPAAAAPAPAAAPAAASPLRGRTEPLSRLRKVIAARMVESLQVAAQLTTVAEVDITRVAALRQRVKGDFEAREGVRLTYLPFFAKAAVEALKRFPQVNASLDVAAGTVTYHDGEHLGIAVDTERGLVVPVVRDAGDLSIGGLARRIADLAERTRTNRVGPDELSGGTFTLTNTGSRGALFDTPIINQPQVAILGTGAVVRRPVVVDDPAGGEAIAVRSMVYLALTYDHRLVDGADAARFLAAVRSRLEEGAFEGDLGL